MTSRPCLGALAACVAAIGALALGPAASHATAPPLVGATTHPLWSNSTPGDSAAELDRLVEAGANVVRIDISWSSLEQDGPGEYADWYVDKADVFFTQARERGLEVIASFWSTPCWASSAPPHLKQDCAGEWWERDVELYPPNDPQDFARAAAWVAQRWGQDLAALEIWNEPNCSCFLTVPDETRVATYAAMLRAAHDEVKALAPAVEVLGAAMLYSHDAFLDALYREGARGYMDGVSVHPYGQWRDPTDATEPEPAQRMFSFIHGVQDLRDTMAEHGDSATPLWFTELGWSSCAPAGTNQWCVTPEVQARHLGAALRLVRDNWDFVRAIAVYNLRNKGDAADDREEQMGLLQLDFTPKPAFWAFKEALADLAANPFSKPLPTVPPEEVLPAPPVQAQGGTTLDLAAPVLGRLSLRPAVLRRGGRRPLVRFSLSERAVVTLRFERARRGRWLALRGSLRHSGRPGMNGVRIGARLAGRRLPAGRYRLTVVARDTAGNASEVRRLRLRIAG